MAVDITQSDQEIQLEIRNLNRFFRSSYQKLKDRPLKYTLKLLAQELAENSSSRASKRILEFVPDHPNLVTAFLLHIERPLELSEITGLQIILDHAKDQITIIQKILFGLQQSLAISQFEEVILSSNDAIKHRAFTLLIEYLPDLLIKIQPVYLSLLPQLLSSLPSFEDSEHLFNNLSFYFYQVSNYVKIEPIIRQFSTLIIPFLYATLATDAIHFEGESCARFLQFITELSPFPVSDLLLLLSQVEVEPPEQLPLWNVLYNYLNKNREFVSLFLNQLDSLIENRLTIFIEFLKRFDIDYIIPLVKNQLENTKSPAVFSKLYKLYISKQTHDAIEYLFSLLHKPGKSIAELEITNAMTIALHRLFVIEQTSSKDKDNLSQHKLFQLFIQGRGISIRILLDHLTKSIENNEEYYWNILNNWPLDIPDFKILIQFLDSPKLEARLQELFLENISQPGIQEILFETLMNSPPHQTRLIQDILIRDNRIINPLYKATIEYSDEVFVTRVIPVFHGLEAQSLLLQLLKIKPGKVIIEYILEYKEALIPLLFQETLVSGIDSSYFVVNINLLLRALPFAFILNNFIESLILSPAIVDSEEILDYFDTKQEEILRFLFGQFHQLSSQARDWCLLFSEHHPEITLKHLFNLQKTNNQVIKDNLVQKLLVKLISIQLEHSLIWSEDIQYRATLLHIMGLVPALKENVYQFLEKINASCDKTDFIMLSSLVQMLQLLDSKFQGLSLIINLLEEADDSALDLFIQVFDELSPGSIQTLFKVSIWGDNSAFLQQQVDKCLLRLQLSDDISLIAFPLFADCKSAYHKINLIMLLGRLLAAESKYPDIIFEKLKPYLNNSDPLIREGTTQVILSFPNILPILITTLQDLNPQIDRLLSQQLTTLIGLFAEDAIPYLLPFIGQTNPVLTTIINHCFIALGNVAIPALLEFINTTDPNVETQLLYIMSEMTTTADVVTPLSQLLATETRPNVIIRLIKILGATGNADAISSLLPFLVHEDLDIKTLVEHSLTNIAYQQSNFRVVIRQMHDYIQDQSKKKYKPKIPRMEISACTSCKEQIPATSLYCNQCGRRQRKIELYCTICHGDDKDQTWAECFNCQTIFHAVHLFQWLDKSQFCPHCKKELDKSYINRFWLCIQCSHRNHSKQPICSWCKVENPFLR